MNKLSLLALLLSSTSLLSACGPDTIDDVIDDGGEFAEPPPEHGPQNVGEPGEEIMEFPQGDKSIWSCKTQKVSLQENPHKFVTLNPNADIIYPGALVQGASLESGSPAPIPVRRGPGKIVLALVTGADTNFQAAMTEVSQANAVDAQNLLLEGVQNDAIPAKFVYDYEMFDSTEKLAAAMDVKAEWLGGSSVHAAAEASLETRKTYAMIRLTQEYFTTTFDMPTSVKDFFHPDVTPGELADYVGPGNPAAYISSVTYGRQFYLVFESSASKQDLKAAVDAVYSGFVVDVSGSLKAEYQATQKSTKVRVFAIGGDAESALAAAANASNSDNLNGMFEQVATYLKKGGTFSTSNPGLPVSYTVRDVARRNVVKVNLGTEYTEKQCNPLVNESFKTLSLDASKAQYDANGVMTRWPGSATKQNEPTSITPNFIREIDSTGHTWARMGLDSFAGGIDCRAFAGNNTVITVTRPDIDKLGYHKAVLSGRAADLSLNWQLGWYEKTGLAIRQWYNGYYGMFAFSTAPQFDGQVSSVLHEAGGTYVWSNGEFANWIVTPPEPGAASGALTHNTATCGIGGLYRDSMEGLVGEIRIYNGMLSNAQKEMVECQLGSKWGIAVKNCGKDGRPVQSF